MNFPVKSQTWSGRKTKWYAFFDVGNGRNGFFFLYVWLHTPKQAFYQEHIEEAGVHNLI